MAATLFIVEPLHRRGGRICEILLDHESDH
jgi:hypothetical protein